MKKIFISVTQTNTTQSARTATLTLAAEGSSAAAATLTVTQNAYTFEPWNRVFGGSGEDNFSAAVATTDGGYIAVGQINSTDAEGIAIKGNGDAWAVKVDAAGQLLWRRSFGGMNYDGASRIVAVGDGYVILGYTEEFAGDTSLGVPLLIKIDEAGETLWTKTYRGTNRPVLNGIAAVPSGGFICAGGENEDALLVRFDGEGNEIWNKTYGGADYDRLFSVAVAADGGFVATGNTDLLAYDTVGRFRTVGAWVLKVDGSGNQLWDHQYGGNDAEMSYWVISTSDGGTLVASTTESPDVPGFKGQMEWQRAYGTTLMDFPYALAEAGNGKYLFGAGVGNVQDGDVSTPVQGSDAWIVEVGSDGNILWQKTFGGTDNDVLTGFAVTADLVVMAGISRSTDGEYADNHGAGDGWIKAIALP
jgi:hypothetical protein